MGEVDDIKYIQFEIDNLKKDAKGTADLLLSASETIAKINTSLQVFIAKQETKNGVFLTILLVVIGLIAWIFKH